jgi:hypothetical protein
MARELGRKLGETLVVGAVAAWRPSQTPPSMNMPALIALPSNGISPPYVDCVGTGWPPGLARPLALGPLASQEGRT